MEVKILTKADLDKPDVVDLVIVQTDLQFRGRRIFVESSCNGEMDLLMLERLDTRFRELFDTVLGSS